MKWWIRIRLTRNLTDVDKICCIVRFFFIFSLYETVETRISEFQSEELETILFSLQRMNLKPPKNFLNKLTEAIRATTQAQSSNFVENSRENYPVKEARWERKTELSAPMRVQSEDSIRRNLQHPSDKLLTSQNPSNIAQTESSPGNLTHSSPNLLPLTIVAPKSDKTSLVLDNIEGSVNSEALRDILQSLGSISYFNIFKESIKCF